MDRAQFMMWSKSRSGATNNVCDDSWEELAFAEDAARVHGGCAWPPRSYTCSFCRREFRSAQALGGHMNAHRRDRARLKQSPDPPPGVFHRVARPNLISQDSLPPQIRRFFLNPSPNTAADDSAMPISSSVVLFQSEGGCHFDLEKFLPHLPTSLNESRDRTSAGVILFPLGSNQFSGSTSEKNGKIPLNRKGDFRNQSWSNPAETDFPMSMSLAMKTRSFSSEEDDEDETVILTTTCKRRRRDEPSPPFILKPRHRPTVSIDELSYSPGEGLDLELRLGERPKVKL
ncbi:hypothetical protein MLD38_023900 [Melastoma candidum]|uniref:Uncharacterized protein n=1 Tax=Melastoma candidum TaxID=119954 RepID=A0ACB9NQG8_9MYRT|nr:hypothetical protein MLD38_023900 [Melastoma candidum]